MAAAANGVIQELGAFTLLFQARGLLDTRLPSSAENSSMSVAPQMQMALQARAGRRKRST